MVTIVARLTTESALHVLVKGGGGYYLHTFFDDPEGDDKPLSDAKAMEWCDTTVACGGQVERGVTARNVRA